MSDIRIAQSWDSLPPVVYDGDEAISTRKLEKDYRDALTRIYDLEKGLREAMEWNWLDDDLPTPWKELTELLSTEPAPCPTS